MNSKQYIIRVYGLLIWDNCVLVSDECIKDLCFTKFPGGGLEWGEGISNCLQREFLEELGIVVSIGELFYLTDFFQESAFNSNHQVISVYYRVGFDNPDTIQTKLKPFQFDKNETQIFRWVKIENLDANEFHFPIDKIVVDMLNGNSL